MPEKHEKIISGPTPASAAETYQVINLKDLSVLVICESFEEALQLESELWDAPDTKPDLAIIQVIAA